MNITLSADEEIVKKTREVAQKNGKSLNGLIREYMKSVAGQVDREAVVKAFKENALHHSGESDEGFRFSREQSHQR